eukprot:jgi/Bigna1/145610/aug1.101_g20318
MGLIRRSTTSKSACAKTDKIFMEMPLNHDLRHDSKRPIQLSPGRLAMSSEAGENSREVSTSLTPPDSFSEKQGQALQLFKTLDVKNTGSCLLCTNSNCFVNVTNQTPMSCHKALDLALKSNPLLQNQNIESIFEEMDITKSGTVSEEEFVETFMRALPLDDQESITNAVERVSDFYIDQGNEAKIDGPDTSSSRLVRQISDGKDTVGTHRRNESFGFHNNILTPRSPEGTIHGSPRVNHSDPTREQTFAMQTKVAELQWEVENLREKTAVLEQQEKINEMQTDIDVRDETISTLVKEIASVEKKKFEQWITKLKKETEEKRSEDAEKLINRINDLQEQNHKLRKQLTENVELLKEKASTNVMKRSIFEDSGFSSTNNEKTDTRVTSDQKTTPPPTPGSATMDGLIQFEQRGEFQYSKYRTEHQRVRLPKESKNTRSTCNFFGCSTNINFCPDRRRQSSYSE